MVHQLAGTVGPVVTPGAMGETMNSEITDPFADTTPPVEPGQELGEDLLRLSFLWAHRNYIPGAWMVFGGKRPEPSRNDPFKLVGEWADLDEQLWTLDSDEVEWWAGHPHPSVRRAVATHETCPPVLLDRFLDDEWVEIRQAALGNNAVDSATVRRATELETVEWLRESVAVDRQSVVGRCAVCGGSVKRPDRFLTCSIGCSILQQRKRLDDGTYAPGAYIYWPNEYVWEVADRLPPGGVPGTGPRFVAVRISYIPGLNAVEADQATRNLAETESIAIEDAVQIIDQMAQTMDGPSILESCK